ncbi:phospho-acceptor domain-containing protein [Dulcicalothrix desertica PCC 7102]|nr:phospho-acceptor domain-containing protein [Dulcicalothrix desertica PCC 7102]
MTWTTVSRYIQSKISKSLSWRIWLAYLTAMSAIFSISATSIYYFFRADLLKDQDERLQTLAQAAVPSLQTIKTKGTKDLNKDLPWRNLFDSQQSLEWFDADGKLIAREGTNFPNFPLAKSASTNRLNEGSPLVEQHGNIRSVSIAVYTDSLNKKILQLEGYIRVNESTKEFDQRMGQLQLGLEVGGVIVLTLSSVSGMFLTLLVIQPIKQSFQNLKQFTADASHELRNPLTVIMTTVELMESHSEQFSADDVRKFKTISTATQQIRHLVEDLRFLSHTDALTDTNVLDYPKVPLDEILQDLADTFETDAQNKKLSFESYLSTDIHIKGDTRQLKRLFANLLENAIKYSRTGGVVKLFLEKHKLFAVVRVEDTGIGIPQEYIPLVFQRFWRAETARLQAKEGLGLGLAIAQAIVQRHLGKITVSSKVGVGSCFQVHLPLA